MLARSYIFEYIFSLSRLLFNLICVITLNLYKPTEFNDAHKYKKKKHNLRTQKWKYIIFENPYKVLWTPAL